ncbi:hypothetical protein MJA45_04030 [Paenibacillus aurantius]|uniref:Uncharacterized protein n=1 Tax=Paenibacillus aurantius TaxID=2918900 RepID=A0AA96LFS0_9BACL|nr:hypothetical protein [Paenibacillus aurantius]WNQ12228.1 hypothetical protein MJA45_04030 [Paenibacillus aurantius]
MLLFIENVEVGSEYEDTIFNYWITARMKDGTIVKIFDYSCLNLISKVAFYVESILFANLSPPGYEMTKVTGKYIGKLEIKDWQQIAEDRDLGKQYDAVETSSGIILFHVNDTKKEFLEGDNIQLNVIRFDLIAVNT